MNLKNETSALLNLLNLTQEELAKEINVSFETINRWESEKNDAEDYDVEKIYSFAFKKKIFLNKIYETIFKEDENESTKVLFHGCKQHLQLPIDLNHSKKFNDFSIGFYLGENLKQAATYIANSTSSKVYTFKLNIESLKVKTFSVSKEWMIAIAYYRGWLEKYKDHKIIKKIIDEIENKDLIIAPITDNKMFDIISEFVRGEITTLQCEHALAATNLGMQYILRTNNALKNLELIHLCYICQPEKESYIQERLDLSSLCQDKVKIARIEFRGKGQYIDELLK